MRAFLALPLLIATAASTPGFRHGLWQTSTAPGTATLDGKRLSDLPYTGPAGPRSICLSSDDVAGTDWLTEGLLPDGCLYDRQRMRDGRIDIAATCPPQAAGLSSGHVRITGRYTATSYALRFATTNPSENGVMGFGGTMTGRRVGNCPNVNPPGFPPPSASRPGTAPAPDRTTG